MIYGTQRALATVWAFISQQSINRIVLNGNMWKMKTKKKQKFETMLQLVLFVFYVQLLRIDPMKLPIIVHNCQSADAHFFFFSFDTVNFSGLFHFDTTSCSYSRQWYTYSNVQMLCE